MGDQVAVRCSRCRHMYEPEPEGELNACPNCVTVPICVRERQSKPLTKLEVAKILTGSL